MTRTYLKSSALAKPSNENVKSTSSSFLLKPDKESSLNSPEIVLKTKKTRKPLLAVGNVKPSLLDDDSLPSNSSSESPPSLSVSANDTFDKLLPKTVDPFDNLFNNVNKKAVNSVLKDISCNVPSHQDVFFSGFSTPSDAEFSTDTTDTSYQAGLFSSFSKQVEDKTPKLKKKSHRNVRPKKLSEKPLNKPRENILSETLSVQVVFEGDSSPRKQDPGLAKVSSSLATLVAESPPFLRVRTLTALSVATSTPVLASRSDQNLPDSSPSGHCDTFSPVRDVTDDDVFERDEAVTTTSPATSSKDSRLPSAEYFDATPPPQKSFVNRSRGKKKFGGPAASIMNHIGWKFSMHTIQAQADNESACRTSLLEPVDEDETGDVEEITVNIACICGSNEMTSSQVIQCDNCAMWFHTDCVDLSESGIEEIESLDLDWFCRACISEARNNPDYTISTPYKIWRSSSDTASSPCIGTSLSRTKDIHIQPNSSLTESPSPVTVCAVSSSSDVASFVESSSNLLPSAPEEKSSFLETSLITLQDESSFSNNPACALRSSFVPDIPSPTTSATMVTTPVSSDASLLSLTLQLEQQHLAQAEGVQDASLLFVKPTAPPKRRQGRIPFVTTEEDIQLKPGKSWRRSLSLAKKSSSTSILMPRPALPSVEFLDPTPVKTMPRRSTRLAPIPAMDDSIILPTPQKSIPRLESKSRTSFCVVPSTPRMSVMDSKNTRLSVLQSLSETLLVENISETIPDFSMTPLDKLLAICNTDQVLPFDKIYPPEVMEGSKKVGEGAFGEVFLIGSVGDDRPVLKVVPIDGDIPVNGEVQTKLEDMLSEVIISNALSKLRMKAPNMTSGFVEVRGCHVFQGAYPPQLLQLWDVFNEEQKSENDRPDNLPVGQLFIALEFNNAGKDLEKYIFKHATQALQAWKQVAHSLAVAEEELQFEHRDLHWGNVLVKETDEKYVQFTLGGDVFQVETGGVKTSIIDFSLSRLSMDKVTIFNNLSEDPSLFTAKGKDHAGGDYQFDIYRKMREVNGNTWEPFTPKTNLWWLDYMLEKMITEVYYSAKKTGKPHKSGVGKMRRIRTSLAGYSSVGEWVRREGERVD